jgi:hypothetical protein
MTLDLDALQKLADNATPGPWWLERTSDDYWIVCDVLRERYGNNALSFGEDHATAEFVTALVNAWPDLLAEVHRLTEENQRQRSDMIDTMRYLVPADLGLDEWPDECPDLPGQLVKILGGQP